MAAARRRNHGEIEVTSTCELKKFHVHCYFKRMLRSCSVLALEKLAFERSIDPCVDFRGLLKELRYWNYSKRLKWIKINIDKYETFTVVL